MSNDHDRFHRDLDDAVDILTKFVIPLYVEDQRGKPIQVGSGFIVAAGKHRILISAAHVLRDAKVRPYFYYIKQNVICNLAGTLILGRIPSGRDDLFDVAGLLLSENAEPPHRELDKFVVDASYIRPEYLPRAGKKYVIIGFPASRSSIQPVDRTVTARSYAYHESSIPEDHYVDFGVSARTHLILSLDLKKCFDSEGNHRNFPKPQGMSGSPIWVLYEERFQAEHRTFPLVGIGTRYRQKDRVLIGTDSHIIAEIVNAAI